MEKAVITVLSTDKAGIVYNVSKVLFENSTNILDISQKVLSNEIFSMVMTVELSNGLSVEELRKKLEVMANDLNLKVFIQDTKLFNSIHRI